MSKYKGKCLCGAIRFEVKGNLENFFFCHCSRCRQVSGTAHSANIFSKVAKLNVLSGEDKIKSYTVPESRFTTTFCVDCGSKIPKNHGGKILQIPAGSLATDLDIKPSAHIFCQSKANWEDQLESVPKFDELPPKS